MGREVILHCEVLGGLEPFERVSRSEVGKAALHGLVRTFISGISILQWKNGGETTQRETHH